MRLSMAHHIGQRLLQNPEQANCLGITEYRQIIRYLHQTRDLRTRLEAPRLPLDRRGNPGIENRRSQRRGHVAHQLEQLSDQAFHPPGKAQPKPLLAKLPNQPPQPVARFPVHSSADGFAFSRSPAFGYPGEAFVAIFGDESPTTGKILSPVGGKVVRVNVSTGVIHDFATNRAPKQGPGTKVGVGGFERPVCVRFDPRGDTLYVIDFGVMRHDAQGAHPERQTGSIWRIRNESWKPGNERFSQ